jgi:uncharacterized membrane protein YphA (DoxX/SURF4 family)
VSTVALVASIVVGLAFLVAGGSKLAAGRSWPAQATALGAPAIAIPTLPWLELGIGAALVLQLGRPVAALAAVVLLIAFSGLIALRLSQGRRPACACFGVWTARPIGPSNLLRNGVLLVLSVVALA